MQNRKKSPVEWFQSLTVFQKVMVIGGTCLVIGVILFTLLYQPEEKIYIADDKKESRQLVADSNKDSKESSDKDDASLSEEEKAIKNKYESEKEKAKYYSDKENEGKNKDGKSDSNSTKKDSASGESGTKKKGLDSDETSSYWDSANYDSGSGGFTKGGNLANEKFDRMEAPGDASYQHPKSYKKSDLERMIKEFYNAVLYPITKDNKDKVMNDMRAIMTTNLYESYFPGGEPEYIESGEREVAYTIKNIELAKNNKVGDDFVEFIVVYDYASVPLDNPEGQLIFTEHAESVTFSLIDGEYRITGITA